DDDHRDDPLCHLYLPESQRLRTPIEFSSYAQFLSVCRVPLLGQRGTPVASSPMPCLLRLIAYLLIDQVMHDDGQHTHIRLALFPIHVGLSEDRGKPCAQCGVVKKRPLRDRHPLAGSGSAHQLRDTSGGKIEIHASKSLVIALLVTVLGCVDQPCHALGAI